MYAWNCMHSASHVSQCSYSIHSASQLNCFAYGDSHCSFFVICIHVICPLRRGHSEARLLACRIGPVDVLVALVPRPGSEGELQVDHSSRALLPTISFLLVVLHLISFQHEPSLLPSLVVATCRGSKRTLARISSSVATEARVKVVSVRSAQTYSA